MGADQVNFQQLRIVQEAVRRHFNLTEVTNSLFTSQSGVSKHIKDLEDELGVEIFVRRGKRLLGLTEPGRELVEIVQRLLLDVKNMRQLAEREHQKVRVMERLSGDHAGPKSHLHRAVGNRRSRGLAGLRRKMERPLSHHRASVGATLGSNRPFPGLSAFHPQGHLHHQYHRGGQSLDQKSHKNKGFLPFG